MKTIKKFIIISLLLTGCSTVKYDLNSDNILLIREIEKNKTREIYIKGKIDGNSLKSVMDVIKSNYRIESELERTIRKTQEVLDKNSPQNSIDNEGGK